jgi:hypothetical protein
MRWVTPKTPGAGIAVGVATCPAGDGKLGDALIESP